MGHNLPRQDASIESSRVPHKIPQIPLVIDRIDYSKEEITFFDGVPLHFLMCRSSIEESVLYAFTSRNDLFKQAKNCSVGKPPMIVREIPDKADTGVVFYAGDTWRGSAYFLPEGHLFELRETWWNKMILSLRGVGQGTMVTLYEELGNTGPTLTLSTDFGWPSLDTFGWEGRVAALMVWPVKGRPVAPPRVSDQ